MKCPQHEEQTSAKRRAIARTVRLAPQDKGSPKQDPYPGPAHLLALCPPCCICMQRHHLPGRRNSRPGGTQAAEREGEEGGFFPKNRESREGTRLLSEGGATCPGTGSASNPPGQNACSETILCSLASPDLSNPDPGTSWQNTATPCLLPRPQPYDLSPNAQTPGLADPPSHAPRFLEL